MAAIFLSAQPDRLSSSTGCRNNCAGTRADAPFCLPRRRSSASAAVQSAHRRCQQTTTVPCWATNATRPALRRRWKQQAQRPAGSAFSSLPPCQPRARVILIQCRTQSTFRDGAARNFWLQQAQLPCAQMSAGVHKRRTVLVDQNASSNPCERDGKGASRQLRWKKRKMKGRSRDTLQRPLCDARPEQRIRSIMVMIADERKTCRGGYAEPGGALR